MGTDLLTALKEHGQRFLEPDEHVIAAFQAKPRRSGVATTGAAGGVVPMAIGGAWAGKSRHNGGLVPEEGAPTPPHGRTPRPGPAPWPGPPPTPRPPLCRPAPRGQPPGGRAGRRAAEGPGHPPTPSWPRMPRPAGVLGGACP